MAYADDTAPTPTNLAIAGETQVVETQVTPSSTAALTTTHITIATSPPISTAEPTPNPAPTQTPTPTPINIGHVTAIGDSVMLGAARELRRSIANMDVDARVSRQASAAIRLAQARQASGTLGDVIIVHIGNNGPIATAQFDQLMQPLQGAKLVVVINLRVPRRWEAGNNLVLAEGVKRYPNAVLLDWNGFTRANPGLIGGDGIHLGGRSSRAYTSLLVDTLTHSLVPMGAVEAPVDITPTLQTPVPTPAAP
jgi:hypothetical protein